MRGLATKIFSAMLLLSAIACAGTSMGGGGGSACGTNCTLTGTWSAWAEVNCASNKPSCGYGIVDAKGNLPTIALPKNYGTLSNVISGPDAGEAAVVTITIANAMGTVDYTSNNCPTLYSQSSSVVYFVLNQANPPTGCTLTLGTQDSKGQSTGQSVSITYSGPG